MKLLLTSSGITNPAIAKALQKLVGRSPKHSKVAFVPTAANTEPDEKNWLIDDLWRIKNLGYSVDIVDISAIGKKMWLPRIRSADVLFFGGGNTYHLLYWLRKSGLERLLPKLLKTRVYAGISAGSIVTGPNLKASSLRQYYPEDVGQDTPGLQYVDFHVRPHLNSPHFPRVRASRIQKDFGGFKKPVYVIDDDTAIRVVGRKVDVVTQGEYLLREPDGV